MHCSGRIALPVFDVSDKEQYEPGERTFAKKAARNGYQEDELLDAPFLKSELIDEDENDLLLSELSTEEEPKRPRSIRSSF